MGEELNAAGGHGAAGLLGIGGSLLLRSPRPGWSRARRIPRKCGQLLRLSAPPIVEPPRDAARRCPPSGSRLPDGTDRDERGRPTSAQVALAGARPRRRVRRGAARCANRRASKAEEVLAGHGGPRPPGHRHRRRSCPAGTFFDLALVHLLTTATLDRSARPVSAGPLSRRRRFRPNIVVATGARSSRAFVESDWVGRDHSRSVTRFACGLRGPCPRCVMTTLAAGRPARRMPGILRTAAQNNQANVGVYADVVKGGTVRRGDHVTVT